MCWSYIFSVRLLEIQGREVRYTLRRLWPNSTRQCPLVADSDLEDASPPLIRWLCAILSADMGWQTQDEKQLPSWATVFSSNVKLVVRASNEAIDVSSTPNSSKATNLLIELCQLFNLGTNPVGDSGSEPKPPYKASFLAALVPPFYSAMKLRPRLSHPHLARLQRNDTFSSSHEQDIHGYLHDIRYVMTLSAHPPSIGSLLWIMFWQPDIDCNLVNPWLASVLDTLQSTIKQKKKSRFYSKISFHAGLELVSGGWLSFCSVT